MKGSTKKFIKVLAVILANVCIVLGALFIMFTILDSYNPNLMFIDGLGFTRHLDIILAACSMVFGILALSLFMAKKKKRPNQQRGNRSNPNERNR